MEIEVFQRQSGFNYESVSILDSFNSLLLTENYYDFNTFELVLPLTRENALLYVPDTILLINNCYYYVESVEVQDATNGTLTISGNSLAGKSKDRIIAEVYTATKAPDAIANDLYTRHVVSPADSNRKLAYLALAPFVSLGLSSGNIQYQDSYDTVQKAVNDLCTTYDFGFKETASNLSNPVNTIQLYKGSDKSAVVEISEEFENLVKQGIQNNTVDFKSTAYVFGEGTGSDRKNTIISPALSGIERRELYVDARDLQQTSTDASGNTVTLSDTDYYSSLTTRGNTNLATQVAILLLSGQINTSSTLFKLDTDYGLGDTIKISSSLFGVEKTATITTLRRTYDNTGEYVEPVFGKETPTIFQILGRK